MRCRPPSRRFPYGYGRVEDLAGVAIVLTIMLSALGAGNASGEAFHRLADQAHVESIP